MKSSSGLYFQGLDHIRAMAVFTVFCWHFIHYGNGHLAPPPAFPLSLFTEGHTGVAIFMTLSGYLFAKLLNGRQVHYRAFFWNRLLRLAPLLVIVLALVALERHAIGTLSRDFWREVGWGWLLPTLPNGGWSITVEVHFYLTLPGLLWLLRKSPRHLFAVLAFMPALRAALYLWLGEVQSLAYWTLVGRMDQFVLGILFFHYRHWLENKGWLVLATVLGFLLFWYAFDARGGFYMQPAYPSPSPVWIYLTLIEGIAYASVIAWYDTRHRDSTHWLARGVALIGTYSYSLYLLHFFVVFRLPVWINDHLFPLTGPYALLMAAVPSFLLLVPAGWASFRFIEAPFLRYRKPYVTTPGAGRPS